MHVPATTEGTAAVDMSAIEAMSGMVNAGDAPTMAGPGMLKINYDEDSIIFCLDKSKTEDTIENLTAEKEITVYLNPSNPKQSALNINIAKSRQSQGYSLLLSGLIIFALGVYLCASNS